MRRCEWKKERGKIKDVSRRKGVRERRKEEKKRMRINMLLDTRKLWIRKT